MSFSEIEREVLEKLKPQRTLEEIGYRLYQSLKEKIEEALKSEGWKGDVTVQGSFAKGTWLATSPELDIFILLDPSFTYTDVKERVFPKLYRLFESLNPKVRFSEHPYLIVEIEGFTVEIVPAIRSEREGEFKTAVDRTPYHTRYVNLKADEYLKDQIRLLKQFARTIGVYSADIAVEGFSGYLLELLALYYGGFRETLEAASRWKAPVVIDLEGHYKSDREAARFFGGRPLIVVDPVDPKRNVASAVSRERLGEFIMASRLYLKRPSIYYFFLPEVDSSERKRLLSLLEPHLERTVIVDVRLRTTLPPDTIWGEAKRACRNIRSLLEREGFEVVRCSAWTNESNRAMVACLLEDAIKPEIARQRGPPVESFEHAMRFVEKYLTRPGCGPWIENGRLLALKERKYPNAVLLLKEKSEEYLVSDFKSGELDVYLLSWKPEVLEEARSWLEEFILGKPKWLLPYYLLLERE
uniref:CCA-adding enzyme n=1 Tax=Fervidicoccus fontis TaxID=683846 RepID=A0A7J3ZKH6_9CREN